MKVNSVVPLLHQQNHELRWVTTSHCHCCVNRITSYVGLRDMNEVPLLHPAGAKQTCAFNKVTCKWKCFSLVVGLRSVVLETAAVLSSFIVNIVGHGAETYTLCSHLGFRRTGRVRGRRAPPPVVLRPPCSLKN